MRGLLVTTALLAAAAAASAPASSPTLTIDAPLPSWLAPGAAFAVTGSTSGRTAVSLLADGARIGSATSGPGGRFTLRGRAPGAGRHRISLVVDGTRVGL